MISFKVHPINGIGPTLEPISANDVEFEWLKLAEINMFEKRDSNNLQEENSEEEEDSDDSEVSDSHEKITKNSLII